MPPLSCHGRRSRRKLAQTMRSDVEGTCSKVLAALVEAEVAALRFARASGLTCPAGCGACCSEDKPHDSVLSALPAARWAVQNGQLELLQQAAAERPDGTCLFYDPERLTHCSVYPLRPLVCRLFGYAGWRDKRGAAQFRPCRRQPRPQRPIEAVPPVFADYATMLASIYPPLGRQRASLNAAFWQAGQWVLLRARYEDKGNSGPHKGGAGSSRRRPRTA